MVTFLEHVNTKLCICHNRPVLRIQCMIGNQDNNFWTIQNLIGRLPLKNIWFFNSFSRYFFSSLPVGFHHISRVK